MPLDTLSPTPQVGAVTAVPLPFAPSASWTGAVRRLAAEKGAFYDEGAGMLKIPFGSPGYHTTLTGGEVHPIRESLWYAVVLLDTGRPADVERAVVIFDRVLALQDAGPETSPTHGIWPWFLEESLVQMSPPDWNWADFCAAQILEALLTHRSRFPAGLVERMEAAVRRACFSIRRRRVSPGYTNIAIMGCFVTMAAGEAFDDGELFAYGLERLREFRDHTVAHGAFSEYNSPVYTLVALAELGRFFHHVRHAEALEIAGALYRRAWEEIAFHYHAPTAQWAGPHSRCYHTLAKPEQHALLQRAVARGEEPEGDWVPEPGAHRIRHTCPDDLCERMIQRTEVETIRQRFIKGSVDVVGTTHLTPRYALGTINHGDLWNQRRALLAFWGDAERPSYLHLRCLHDGRDFAAAVLFSVQDESRVLGGVSFAHDAGDSHPNLDMIRDRTITARDLRLRFEFGGAAGATEPLLPAGEVAFRVDAAGITLDLQVPFSRWGEVPGRLETGSGGGIAWIDVVLHSGPETVIDLGTLAAAGVVFALELEPGRARMSPATVGRDGSFCDAAWAGLRLRTPVVPDTQKRLIESYRVSGSVV